MVIVKIKKLWYLIHWGKKLGWSKDKAKVIKKAYKLLQDTAIMP